MSQPTDNNQRSRQGNQRRSSRGSNQRRRNRSNHSEGGQQRGGGPSRSPQNRDRRRQSEAPRQAEPVKLTLWQKILKIFGLYKEPVPTRGKRPQKKFDEQQGARKNNTRVAKGRTPRQTPNVSDVSGTRLYIGNLSYDASESDLEDLFKGAGQVRGVDIVYNRATHRSKGFGFVEMGNLDDAKRAIEVLHDQPFMGRQLIVNSARAASQEGDDAGDQEQDETLAEQN